MTSNEPVYRLKVRSCAFNNEVELEFLEFWDAVEMMKFFELNEVPFTFVSITNIRECGRYGGLSDA